MPLAALCGPLPGAAFELRPLCVAQESRSCDHVCPRWDGHNPLYTILRFFFRARHTGFYHGVGAL